jgi:hypothetical protein
MCQILFYEKFKLYLGGVFFYNENKILNNKSIFTKSEENKIFCKF